MSQIFAIVTYFSISTKRSWGNRKIVESEGSKLNAIYTVRHPRVDFLRSMMLFLDKF